MASREDLESFIARLDADISSEEVDPGIWVLAPGEDNAPVVVSLDPPVVVFRAKVMDMPEPGQKKTDLMQKLLELNAAGLMHGSYGIEGSHVVLTDALQLENLDFNEFQASIDSITLALASHIPAL
ncbi:MAG: hypothetical protein IH966_01155, partial [Gemmatimonadetes bacterium]|nr:hypothetical protein [Gemmatimonadota bacterium]